MAFKGFYDENAITEDMLFDMKGAAIIKDYKGDAFFLWMMAYNLTCIARGEGIPSLLSTLAREAREEQEEGIEESEDEDSEALDLLGIVTKRIMFEVVDLIPNAEAEEMRKSAPIQPVVPEKTSTKTSSASAQPKPETKMSIWKAAYDAVGLERVRRNQIRPPPTTMRRRRRIKPIVTEDLSNAENAEDTEAGPSSASNRDPDNPPAPANDDGDDVEME